MRAPTMGPYFKVNGLFRLHKAINRAEHSQKNSNLQRLADLVLNLTKGSLWIDFCFDS